MSYNGHRWEINWWSETIFHSGACRGILRQVVTYITRGSTTYTQTMDGITELKQCEQCLVARVISLSATRLMRGGFQLMTWNVETVLRPESICLYSPQRQLLCMLPRQCITFWIDQLLKQPRPDKHLTYIRFCKHKGTKLPCSMLCMWQYIMSTESHQLCISHQQPYMTWPWTWWKPGHLGTVD